MNHEELVSQTAKFVKETLTEAEAGHDWWHTQRVWKMAKRLADDEKANKLVVELAALLHDIADAKFHGGDEEIGARTADAFLKSIEIDSSTREHVVQIVRNASFRGGNFQRTFNSPELKIVQDADRLDALGAIGIARTFQYGGYKNREMYNPEVEPQYGMTKEEYKNQKSPTINHFYEKLLLLSDLMHSESAKKIAKRRHRFMEQFLAEFYEEWEGEN